MICQLQWCAYPYTATRRYHASPSRISVKRHHHALRSSSATPVCGTTDVGVRNICWLIALLSLLQAKITSPQRRSGRRERLIDGKRCTCLASLCGVRLYCDVIAHQANRQHIERPCDKEAHHAENDLTHSLAEHPSGAIHDCHGDDGNAGADPAHQCSSNGERHRHGASPDRYTGAQRDRARRDVSSGSTLRRCVDRATAAGSCNARESGEAQKRASAGSSSSTRCRTPSTTIPYRCSTFRAKRC
jgi:hypothetical protein